MSQYVHHVPGRLRVRSRAFQCAPESVAAVESRLRETEGVLEVRHNARIGSLTVQYDPASDAGRTVLKLFADAGCLPVGGSPAASGPRSEASPDLVSTFGKAVVTALAQQAVTRSMGSLATLLR